uniref:Endoplasmic reticulum lectin n=1 Tax=Pavo cristatus TaxID=9049 RepID=A0A8C9FUP1_PAVCR
MCMRTRPRLRLRPAQKQTCPGACCGAAGRHEALPAPGAAVRAAAGGRGGIGRPRPPAPQRRRPVPGELARHRAEPGVCGLRGGVGGPFGNPFPNRVTCGLLQPTTGVLYREDNYILMTTADKERYKCVLPLTAGGAEIESYWTYEVCHGKHIRQYHEEKETGQKINIQEYYLGNMMMKTPLSEPDQEEKEKPKESAKEIPTKNIEGQMTPYYPVEMGNGTPCSLRQNLPRSSTVMYICHPEAKHEILSVAEVTTCEYEVVILTPLLCNHPKYRFRASPVNDIFCQSLPGSPLKPHNLEQLEKQQEMMKMPFRRAKEVGGFFFLSLKVFTVHVTIHITCSSVEQVASTYVRRPHQTLEQSLSSLLIYVAYLIGRKTLSVKFG